MGEAFRVFQNFFSQTSWMVIFFAALAIVLILAGKTSRRWLLAVGGVFVLFVFNDLTRKLLGALFDATVFYRFLWIVPFSVIIAAAVVMLIRKVRQGWLKALILLAAIILFAVCGPNYVNKETLAPPDNKYLLSDDVLEIAETIRQDVGTDRKYRAATGSVFNMQVRCYTENFLTVIERPRLIYARLIDWDGELTDTERLLGLVEYGRQDDPALIMEALMNEDVEYVVLFKEFGFNDYLASCGCSLIAEGETFSAYRVDLPG